jgi:hypothetical protein
MKRITNIICLALLLFAVVGFALAPTTRAVTPAPDGAYPGGNTAEGHDALLSLTSGTDNTALGKNALEANTTGSNNTANGSDALKANTTGFGNTANGADALQDNIDGDNNTACGFQAMKSNTTGSLNTAIGFAALGSNTSGYENTASGFFALLSNTTGFGNTASGWETLSRTTTGHDNTATGLEALVFNTSGSYNTAYGDRALFVNTSGDRNIAVGYRAGTYLTTGNENIDIGNKGVAGESNTIRIGAKATQSATFIAGIRGTTTANMDAVPVVIDSAGQLGTVSSSERFKKDIKPIDKSSEAILGLKPVTFHYKEDSTRTPQFGLIAEQVAKVDPELVVRDEDGEIYTVRYDAVNAMLLNEFLKEHRTVQEQAAKLEQQQKQIEALTVGLQKVNARIELDKSAPRLTTDN